ncbi:hypothetical protein OpiT1DRAFT_05614 [Opitutaceae bacterium TAV1]|nr:hypothetical protein OpiT1DRAFT_05614 [Opitutaceae bacterium TAV1]
MALTRYGEEFAYGIPEGAAVAGIVSLISFEVGEAFETNVNAKNEEGEVVAHLVGNKKYTFRAEGYAAAASPPVVGGVITFGDISGVITSVSKPHSNEDFVRYSVEGEGYAEIDYSDTGGGGGGGT